MLFLLLALTVSSGKAQYLFFYGSRNQALADATVGLNGCWSVFGNQAGLAAINSVTVGGTFQNRFLVDELSERAGFVTLPILSSVFAFSLAQFGHVPFLQEKYGLAYARQVSPHLNFGMQFNCYRLFLSEEGHAVNSYGAEVGIQYLFTEKFVLGLHVVNPYRSGVKLSSGAYRYPSQVRLGVCCQFSNMFILTSEIEHDFDDHFIVRNGLEYTILKNLFVRAGVAGKPYQFSTGIGFQVKKLTMDLATSYNQYLGNSPSVSFQYQF